MAKSPKVDHWSREELKAATIAYVEMLRKEMDGIQYSKTDHRKRLREGMLSARSEGSIEYRMQNISSILESLGIRRIEGYKPAVHIGEKRKSELRLIVNEVLTEVYLHVQRFETSGSQYVNKSPKPKFSRGPSPRQAGYIVKPLGERQQTAFTYIAQFGETDVFKIGYSNDPTRRLSELNAHVPSLELPNIPEWKILRIKQWASLVDAYVFEQAFLNKLSRYRTAGERVMITRETITSAWDNSIS